ncbi:hypothetical protein A9G34_00920 [Gilliamella sp. Choc4-2]|uniref:antiterminator Q family protein n=1 Tax=Gilliamella sp. Choc4-2 TaxID=3120237 RepID=UPI00080DA2FA|nr:antiterminator Q family protein [Gilliamella apicola]OCG45694.1 hypothetical protein A9G34_00920 [Gilliamella apicola]
MLAEYVYVDDEPKEIVKPVTRVRFQADYEITDVLRLWGNWSRKEAYKKQGALSLYQSQEPEYKELCSDSDGLIIDGIISSMKNLRFQKTKEEALVLIKSYYGDEILDDDYVFIERYKVKEFCSILIRPRTLREIASELGCSEGNVRKIKSSGESHVIGALAQQTQQTGMELELFKKINLFK